MHDRILTSLKSIEAEHNVRILFACESGSRAWGFASPDSDYDVRFVYARPLEAYLSVSPPRDVIELPIVDDLDVNGWDLQKSLRLLLKSNPPLLEWIASPIVYRQVKPLLDRLHSLRDLYFSPKSCLHHYLNMARSNYRDYLQRDSVRRKKYLYVLRPVLACRWIEQTGTIAPTEFARMVITQVDDQAVRAAIDDLLAEKTAGSELGEGPRIDILNEFCEREIDRLETVVAAMDPAPKLGVEQADAFLVDTLGKLWQRS